MSKEYIQKRIEKFKKYYSKHLGCFSCNECDKCPLNEGLEFGMSCDIYFSEIFGIQRIIGCSVRREACIELLKEEYVNRVNKI